MSNPHLKALLLMTALTPTTVLPSVIPPRNVSHLADSVSGNTDRLVSVAQQSPNAIPIPTATPANVEPQAQVTASEPSVPDEAPVVEANEQPDIPPDIQTPPTDDQTQPPDAAPTEEGEPTNVTPPVKENAPASSNNTVETDPTRPSTPSPPAVSIHGNRTGIWTTLNCSMPAVREIFMDPAQRWLELDTPRAFQDVVDTWKTYDRPNNRDFLKSVENTIADIEGQNCGHISDPGCAAMIDCQHFENQPGTGPAGFLIHNSFVNIHNIYARFGIDLMVATGAALADLDGFVRTFAPLPPPNLDDQWLKFVFDMIITATTGGFGKILGRGLLASAGFAKLGDDNTKAGVETLMRGVFDFIRDAQNKPAATVWDAQGQHDFKTSISTGFRKSWEMAATSLQTLFDGTDESVHRLANLIDKGQMLPGSTTSNSISSKSDIDLVKHSLATMFGFAVPQAWRLSGHHVFILDPGTGCDNKQPTDTFITTDTDHRSRVCVDGKLYFVVMPPNEPSTKERGGGGGCMKFDACMPTKSVPNQFVSPPGIETLDGKNDLIGNINLEQIVRGSLISFRANNNKNGKVPFKADDINNVMKLADNNLEIPGFFNLPICSGRVAHDNWGKGDLKDPNFPC